MKLAIIPARGGSKRIPRKNIKIFAGKPMISWVINAARQSCCFDRIIVSTDDPEVAQISIDSGAEVPFIRPEELADDHTGTIPVVAHAINWLNKNGYPVSEACCMYATAPFIRPEDICQGLLSLQREYAQYAFAVTNYGFPIQRAIRITKESRVEMLHPECFGVRSQDLEEIWHDAAQFYWGKASAWLAQTPVFSADAVPIFLPRYRVQDIDTPDDWIRAELMFEYLNRISKE